MLCLRPWMFITAVVAGDGASVLGTQWWRLRMSAPHVTLAKTTRVIKS